MNNLFITFEGPEGAGKTSVLEKIKLLYPNILFTREPGGIDIAERIRDVILDPSHTAMQPRTEALLYAAARAQHFYDKVAPALEHQHVICDRFIDSSLAYQGHARGIGMKEVATINQFAIGDRMPDYTIFFDIQPELGLQRVMANRNAQDINRLDQEALSFHEAVYNGYELLINANPNRFIIINATQPFEDVVSDTKAILSMLFARHATLMRGRKRG